MGILHGLRSVGHFTGTVLKKVGALGVAGLRKVGELKASYDKVNDHFGGLVGDAISSIPVAGPMLHAAGKFLNSAEKVKNAVSTFHHLGKAGASLLQEPPS